MLGLVRGESFDTLFVTGVALAVAAIPTGLPAVVTALLSIGTRRSPGATRSSSGCPPSRPSGSTSAICSDKTGTLTLNKMTAREMAIPGQNRFTVSGEGYGTQGEIKHVGGSRIDLDPYLLPMVLCADAVLDGESLIGDPTEGALIVLGRQGRAGHRRDPRHLSPGRRGPVRLRLQVHGDVPRDDRRRRPAGRPVLRQGRARRADLARRLVPDPDGTLVPVTDENRHLALEANDRIAEGGERVMVVAQRDFDPATFDPTATSSSLVQDLTLLAMVGIVDPPRPEAKARSPSARAPASGSG